MLWNSPNIKQPHDFFLDIAKGEIPGHTPFRQFGYNSSIGATLEDITESGVINVDMPVSALAMECLSSNAADAGVLLTSGTTDTTGDAITLIDTTKNFLTLGVVAGDFVTDDTHEEYGLVQSLATTTNPNDTIIFDDPLANGDAWIIGHDYRIIDKSAGGTGSQLVEIHGLLDDWTEAGEFVILNGVTPVATVNNYRRINNYHTMCSGSGGVAVGNVDVRQVATPANIMDRIFIGGNMSLQAYYTVPIGKTAYVTQWSAGSDGNASLRFMLLGTADYSDRRYLPDVFHYQDIIVSDGSASPHVIIPPLKFPAKSTIKVSANRTKGSAGAGGCSFGFVLENA